MPCITLPCYFDLKHHTSAIASLCIADSIMQHPELTKEMRRQLYNIIHALYSGTAQQCGAQCMNYNIIILLRITNSDS